VISKRALSYAEAVLFLKPNCYWQMGEASGDLADSVGGVTLADAGTPVYAWAGAMHDDRNTAVLLDGSTEFFSAADANALDLGDTFSIVAWVARAVDDALHMICMKGSGAYELRIADNNTLQLNRSLFNIIVSSTATITGTAYHHVCATKDGSTVKLYIDGVDVTGTVSNQTLVDTTATIQVGNSTDGGGTQFFNGALDELALFAYALTADQVRWLYGIGLQGDLKRRAA